MDTEYNGWTNYPTWAVNLWLCNDEGLDATLTEYARRNDPEGLSAYVRDDLTPELPAGPGADFSQGKTSPAGLSLWPRRLIPFRGGYS